MKGIKNIIQLKRKRLFPTARRLYLGLHGLGNIRLWVQKIEMFTENSKWLSVLKYQKYK